MASSTRILFITGEVSPYTDLTDVSSLVRSLPEELQDAGDVEARIFMPQYGTISERKNSLHEVIRLSGTEVPMGDGTETVTVKVATIPDTRVQVYFMDNPTYFKRKAVVHDDDEAPFDDNPERALFFARSVLETIKKLRWSPDIIHGIGWASGFAPALLHSQYADDDIVGNTSVVYTPDAVNCGGPLDDGVSEALQLPFNDAAGKTLSELGQEHSDATVHPANVKATASNAQPFAKKEERAAQLLDLYNNLLNEVPA